MPLLRRPPKATIASLYGAIVAQARHTRFYEDYGVPDTVLGRFDMIVLHVVLVVRRLQEGEPSHRELAQGVFDTFCVDMDHNLREMGISDPGIPKQMKKVGQAFYGRAHAYEAALTAEGDDALRDTLARNVYAEAAEPAIAAAALTAYVRQTARDLSAQGLDALAKGQVRFPEPARLAAAE